MYSGRIRPAASKDALLWTEPFFLLWNPDQTDTLWMTEIETERMVDMSLYTKVSTDMNFVEREQEVLKFWEDNQIFEKSMKIREGCPTYTFYDGPPTANGKPHIGHVETRAIKDMIPRYRTMKQKGW